MLCVRLIMVSEVVKVGCKDWGTRQVYIGSGEKMFAGELERCDSCSMPREIVVTESDTAVVTGDTAYLRSRLSWCITKPSTSNPVICLPINQNT